MMDWLILAAGGWGGNYVQAARKLRGVRVVGYSDVNPKVLKKLRADGVDEKLLFDDSMAAIKATRPDVISCSVPNPHRVPILLAAIKTGAPVLVDKPLAHTPADVRKIIAAAAKSGSRVCVAQNYRFWPGTLKVKALLDAGRTGRLSNVAITFMVNGAVHGPDKKFYGKLDGPKSIGLEMAIHHWDLMRWLMGCEAEAVQARSWRPKWGWGTADTALQALAGFAGGLRVTYSGDWACRADHTPWSGRWTMSGERADLVWDREKDGTEDIRLRWAAKGAVKEKRFVPRDGRDSVELVSKLFLDAVKTGGPMPVPLEDNVRTIGLALAAVESCRRRKEIDVQRFIEKEGLVCR